MATERHLNSAEARQYLADRGLDRAPKSLDRWVASGELLPAAYVGRERRFHPLPWTSIWPAT